MNINKLGLSELTTTEQQEVNGGVVTVGITFIIGACSVFIAGVGLGLAIGDHFWSHN